MAICGQAFVHDLRLPCFSLRLAYNNVQQRVAISMKVLAHAKILPCCGI